MNSEFYVLTTYWVIFIAIIITFATIWLYRIGKASNKSQLTVGLLFTALLIFMHWGFGGENFLPADLSGISFFVIILAVTVLVNAFIFITSWKIFKNIPQEHIQIVQGIRVFIGSGFLMEGVVAVIPGWFSIMDGFLHISSGFLALVAAIAFIQNTKFRNKLLWIANIVGISDILIIITSICFVVWSDLGPHHNMQYIVFSGGPIFLWLHFVSIMKLKSQAVN